MRLMLLYTSLKLSFARKPKFVLTGRYCSVYTALPVVTRRLHCCHVGRDTNPAPHLSCMCDELLRMRTVTSSLPHPAEPPCGFASKRIETQETDSILIQNSGTVSRFCKQSNELPQFFPFRRAALCSADRAFTSRPSEAALHFTRFGVRHPSRACRERPVNVICLNISHSTPRRKTTERRLSFPY
jgi:hypothetical protein